MTRLILAFITIFSLVLPVVALAHPEHSKKVMGTVTMAGADHVMLKTPEGKDQTIAITSTTKILQGKSKVKTDALKPGTRIVVTLTDKEPPTAEEIQIAPAATAKQ